MTTVSFHTEEGGRIVSFEVKGHSGYAEAGTNVVAQIDAQDIQVSVGKQNLTVQIYVPAASGVFAVGSYTVECNITSR